MPRTPDARFPQAASTLRPYNKLAVWDRSWYPLEPAHRTADGFPDGYPIGHECVNAIVVHDGVVYIGGRFTQAGGVPAQAIAGYATHGWFALGEGVHGTVNALAILGNHLLVGGDFDKAGGRPVGHFARWRLR